MSASPPKRFRVAFSFTGEKRDYVGHVADILARRFGEEKILYDKYLEAELARKDLGIYLPDLYHHQSDLVVVVVCPDYDKKPWTGLEWSAIHALFHGRQHEVVMLCRFGRAELRGLYPPDGAAELDYKSAEELSTLILERLATNEGKPKDQYTRDQPFAPAEVPPSERIPRPPDFYFEPAYLGSHDFVGRASQLQDLDEWATAADPHPMLLFEAIGGSGKSMLTWHWINHHATTVRSDWAGRFWYSFYEKGAVLADFCQRALAYMSGRPLSELRRKKTTELAPLLLEALRARPWLLVLDGLERVLVSYHRIDAAQLCDEDAGSSDIIASRDPCAAIRPEDDELLRQLATAAPSKLLLTSRLMPKSLLNPSSQAVPGVLRVPLPGLRPPDAEALFRACGIFGSSARIQAYLKTHCDCHPLVTGVLAGLVNDSLAHRGDFDEWEMDPEGGGRLNLAELDLVQKRNHILTAAIAAVPEKGRQLLSTLALLSEAVDYEVLKALNPHLPVEVEEVEVPERPEEGWDWESTDEPERQAAREEYAAALQRRAVYERAVSARLQSNEYRHAQKLLATTAKDLERRGLLQYDRSDKRYDLHPVVRGVAGGGLGQEEKERYGQRVVDHFSRQAHRPYAEAETLEDVRDGLHVVRTLLQMGRYEGACHAFTAGLSDALSFNLEAMDTQLGVLRAFFPSGWLEPPSSVGERSAEYLVSDAAWSLARVGEVNMSQQLYNRCVSESIWYKNWYAAIIDMLNIGGCMQRLGSPARRERTYKYALGLATLAGDATGLFCSRLDLFGVLANRGRWLEAQATWELLDRMGRDWLRNIYRPGDAELAYASYCLFRGNLEEAHLAHAEALAREGRSRVGMRALLRLRGEWACGERRWTAAVEPLREAVRMAREIGQVDANAETLLALAHLALGRLLDPPAEARRLTAVKDPAHLPLAELWLAIGDRDAATRHALIAYKHAWADGEPYVYRYDLDRSRALLEQLGVPIPVLPPYDPAKHPKFPWEDELLAALEKLRAEKAEKAGVGAG